MCIRPGLNWISLDRVLGLEKVMHSRHYRTQVRFQLPTRHAVIYRGGVPNSREEQTKPDAQTTKHSGEPEDKSSDRVLVASVGAPENL